MPSEKSFAPTLGTLSFCVALGAIILFDCQIMSPAATSASTTRTTTTESKAFRSIVPLRGVRLPVWSHWFRQRWPPVLDDVPAFQRREHLLGERFGAFRSGCKDQIGVLRRLVSTANASE